MDLKKEFKDIVKYGQESKENKKKAVNVSLIIITLLASKNKIEDIDLDKFAGAGNCFIITCIWSNDC